MRIDTSRAWDAILNAARLDATVSTKMRQVIDVCSTDYPHRDWERIARLPFDQDVERLAAWIPTVLEREPPDIQIEGLWFGLCNPVFGDTTAELYFSGAESFDPEDEDCEWATEATYYPSDAYSGSRCLRRIYSIAYLEPSEHNAGLGNDAEWSLCLAFALFALQELLRQMSPRDFASDADRVGVVVGFDSGDFLPVGLLTSHGLQPTGAATSDSR